MAKWSKLSFPSTTMVLRKKYQHLKEMFFLSYIFQGNNGT